MFDEQPNSGQALTPQDYWQILCRRRWWLLVPTFVCWLGAWTTGWLATPRYRSEAIIVVEQQKVPEEYVVANVSVDAQQRVESMKQQIMSRTRLTRIINQFNLYQNLRKSRGMDAAVDQMRDKDASFDNVQTGGKRGDISALTISYVAPTAQLAQMVNTQLTSLFIDENIQEQAQQAENTTAFLSSELEDARGKLAQQEARIKEFKGHHLGELPTQMETNVQILSGLQERYRNLTQTLSRAQEQKLYLESLLAQYRSVRSDHGAGSLPALDQELERLRAELTAAQTRYTDKHPDVVRLKGQLAKTEKLKQQIETDLAKSGDTPADKRPTTAAELQAMSPMLQIQGQLKANEQEIENTRKQLQQLETQIGGYQSRLNAAPVREQQLADLTRDYDQSKANYDSLLKKYNLSQTATNLEKRQQGQQFRIVDPPNLPLRPDSPNRIMYSLGGLIAGLLVGLACAAVLEFTHDRVRGRQDVNIEGARILVGIPHLTTPEEEQRLVRRRVLEWCAAGFIVLVMSAGNALTFLKG